MALRRCRQKCGICLLPNHKTEDCFCLPANADKKKAWMDKYTTKPEDHGAGRAHRVVTLNVLLRCPRKRFGARSTDGPAVGKRAGFYGGERALSTPKSCHFDGRNGLFGHFADAHCALHPEL